MGGDSLSLAYKLVEENHYQISSNADIAGNKCLVLESMNKCIVPIEKRYDHDQKCCDVSNIRLSPHTKWNILTWNLLSNGSLIVAYIRQHYVKPIQNTKNGD